MSVSNFVKSIQNFMRGDSGVNGDAQRIAQMTWMIFLKVYNAKESDWEDEDDNYKSVLTENLRWRNWAVDKKDGKILTGDDLLNFVNNELFPTIKNLELSDSTPMKQAVVKEVFSDINQYMKNGTILRQVINEIDKIKCETAKEKNLLSGIYETILKGLQSAGYAGEFYH